MGYDLHNRTELARPLMMLVKRNELGKYAYSFFRHYFYFKFLSVHFGTMSFFLIYYCVVDIV